MTMMSNSSSDELQVTGETKTSGQVQNELYSVETCSDDGLVQNDVLQLDASKESVVPDGEASQPAANGAAVSKAEEHKNPAARLRAERYPVKWRAALEMGKDFVYGNTIDVSTTGAGIIVATNLPLKRPVRLHLQLPPAHCSADREAVSLEGRIAYAILSGRPNGFLIGVESGKPAAPVVARLTRHFHSGRSLTKNVAVTP